MSLHFKPAQLSEADFQQLGLTPLKAADKRQAEYLAGRYCANRALVQLLNQDCLPDRHPDTGHPIWPANVCGSISHSHGWAASVTAHTRDWMALGLDIERSLSAARAERLQHAILTPSELDVLAQLEQWHLADFITCVFSAKESLFKALNPLTQTYFGFHDAEVTRVAANGSLELRLLTTLSPLWPRHSIVHGQWAHFAHGFITLMGVPAVEPSEHA